MACVWYSALLKDLSLYVTIFVIATIGILPKTLSSICDWGLCVCMCMCLYLCTFINIFDFASITDTKVKIGLCQPYQISQVRPQHILCLNWPRLCWLKQVAIAPLHFSRSQLIITTQVDHTGHYICVHSRLVYMHLDCTTVYHQTGCQGHTLHMSHGSQVCYIFCCVLCVFTEDINASEI